MSVFTANRYHNPIEACRHNEKVVLHLLRLHKSASKASLARLTGLTAAAIGGIISELSSKGLVMEAGKRQGDMGQPATLFRLAPGGAYGFGVSINRGSIETLLINFVGEIVSVRKHNIILPEPENVVQIVLGDLEELAEEEALENCTRIAGIGIAQPYHLASWDSEAWENWDTFDLSGALRKATGIPTLSENDGNTAALAELTYGLGREEEEFIYLYLGPALVKSFGGGVVLNGRHRRGYTGNAGDIGLMPVPPSKLPTSKPSDGYDGTFLTSRASLFSLVQYLRHCGAEIETHVALEKAIAAYPEQVNEWLEDSVAALETAVHGIQAVLDVPYVVIDGEDEDQGIICRIIDGLGGRLSSAYKKSRPTPKVKRGSFGSQAAAIGAATMPLDSHFSPKPDSTPY